MYTFPLAPLIEDPLLRVGRFDEPEALDKIVEHCDKLPISDGYIGFTDARVDLDRRVSRVGWIHPGPQTNWIYQIVTPLIQNANSRYWQFDLSGFHDALQYTVYDTVGSHFDWHLDLGEGYKGPQRKLSFSLILSDPSEYEGGEFEFQIGQDVSRVSHKERGTFIAFPSYVLHRVTPITKGTRRSLVGWVCGPKFK